MIKKREAQVTRKKPHRAPAPARRTRSRSRASASAKPSSLALIEGRRACIEALEQGVSIARALIQKDLDAPEFSQLTQRLRAARVPLQEVDADYLDSLSSHGAHQGVVLEIKPFVYTELKDALKLSLIHI